MTWVKLSAISWLAVLVVSCSGGDSASLPDAGIPADSDGSAPSADAGIPSDAGSQPDATVVSDAPAASDGSDNPMPGEKKRVAIHPGDTTDAELVAHLPVAQSESGATRRIVMHLGPGQIPGLVAGDRLVVAAEVEVTTRCDIGQTAPGCGYNPNVGAQLILTGARGDKNPGGAESKALSVTQTQTCTKNEHHCMFVFRPSGAKAVLDGGFNLPCVESDSCHVNLVMWAWHPDARAGGQDVVLVGANEGNFLENGIVEPDKGRLMIVRERGITADDRVVRETSGGGAITVPTNANPVLIYSHRLRTGDGDLVAGEQYLIEAKVVADVNSRARFSTKMFLTKNPDATDGNGLAKTFPEQIGEHNGFNCTPGTSPCTTRKVGVFRVTGDINGPVYVNIAVRSAVPGGGSAQVTVDRGKGWLRSTRYRAALRR